MPVDVGGDTSWNQRWLSWSVLRGGYLAIPCRLNNKARAIVALIVSIDSDSTISHKPISVDLDKSHPFVSGNRDGFLFVRGNDLLLWHLSENELKKIGEANFSVGEESMLWALPDGTRKLTCVYDEEFIVFRAGRN